MNKKSGPKKGELWTNLVSGEEYRWNGYAWEPTGNKPHGDDPMKLLAKPKASAEKP